MELGTLLNAVRDGTQLAFELTDTEGSVTVSPERATKLGSAFSLKMVSSQKSGVEPPLSHAGRPRHNLSVLLVLACDVLSCRICLRYCNMTSASGSST